MKILIILLASISMQKPQPDYISLNTHFNRNEMRFIKSVIKMCDSKPDIVYRLSNGKIAMNYPDKRLVLGHDGFIHGIEILEGDKWIDLGPEY